MYLEKDFLIKKINEWCEHTNKELTFEEKDMLASSVSRILDKERVLTFDEFVELLDHNEAIEQYSDIDFDDEIISIEECGEIEMIDFDVSGNKLFFADNILTHNSAVGNVDGVDNSAVSDSMGSVMTADFMLFLLQNDEMKEAGEIVCKCTKNRFTGRTDTWFMNIDYQHMRFSDMIIQNSVEHTELKSNTNTTLSDDFGIVTAEKQQKGETFAKEEITDIVFSDIENVKKQDKENKIEPKTSITSEIDEIMNSLGIDI